MSAAAAQQTPAVPPRPSRAAEKETALGALPKVPPRPATKRMDRSTSPNPDRFAPSPFNGGAIAKVSAHGPLHGQKERSGEPIDRAGNVSMPSVGEEGAEYSAVSMEGRREERQASLPAKTHTVAVDLKLHAPKPSLPAASAKKQVMAVTRTDSERAASFGIGRPASIADERTASRNSNKKRPGSSFSAHSDHHTDDEHGIPEIGQRVPMNPHLGDVQAPSPSPGLVLDGFKKHHGRKQSGRGLPPGSYGLHGHGVAPQDKLEKAYYQKHPDVMEREQHTPLHDRQNDFAMSSSDLNRLVRDTANRQSSLGTAEFSGTPTDEVAFQASEEYTSRISSSAPASAASPRKPSAAISHVASEEAEKPIHVDDARHPEFYLCGDEANVEADEEEEYKAPILASDEVNKDPSAQLQQHPAVHPHPDRRDSLQDSDEPTSRPTSRPSSARAVGQPQPEFGSTPLEDVEEYEPLFSEETKEEKPRQEPADENECRHHFPSKDIWEDAPSSAHYTALVSTPDVMDQGRRRSSAYFEDRPITPAQAFAQYQEQLAESEAGGRAGSFASASTAAPEEKPTWIDHQPHLSPKRVDKLSPTKSPSKRFPSRDVWEDAPESQLHQAIVSGPPTDGNNKAEASRPARMSTESSDQPAVPDRPKMRQSSGDSATKQKPPLSDKPKPHIPPRPTKGSPGESREAPLPKPKPAVPSRPVGGKIAALQAGFMSDLNNRLRLGPHAPKKDDAQQEVAEEVEKAPLADARKSRARGPQRRAPAKTPSPSTATTSPHVANAAAPALTLSVPHTSWAIDPDDGDVAVGTENEATPDTGTEAEEMPDEPVALKEKTQAPSVSTNTSPARDPRAEDKARETEEAGKAAQGGWAGQPAEEASAEVLGKQQAEAEPATVEKTLVANLAGESILEAAVREGTDGHDVEPVAVHDHVGA